MPYTALISSALIIMLVIVAGVLMVKDRTRTLRPFDRETTIPLRGLLAIIIVGSHLPLGIYTVSLIPVALFFLLSGYGVCMSYKKKGVDYLKSFIPRRCSKLLPAFITLSLLSALLAILVEGKSLVTLLKEMAEGATVLPHSWFILAILYVYVTFYISALAGKTLRRTGCLLVIFTLIYIFITKEVTHWGHYWYTTILAVNLGYYLAMYEDRIERLIMRHTLSVYASAVALVFLSLYGRIKLIISIPLPYEIWLCFWSLSAAVACYLIIRTLGIIRWRPMVWLGIISMEIYLVHGLVQLYVSKGLGVSDAEPRSMIYVYTVSCYALSIFAAWIIHKIFGRTGRR